MEKQDFDSSIDEDVSLCLMASAEEVLSKPNS